jgi:hypothetical protein
MVLCPPERPLLHAGRAKETHHKLNESISHIVSTVTEIPVVDTCNEEHAQKIESDCKPYQFPLKGNKEYENRREVKQDERHVLHCYHPVLQANQGQV